MNMHGPKTKIYSVNFYCI